MSDAPKEEVGTNRPSSEPEPSEQKAKVEVEPEPKKDQKMAEKNQNQQRQPIKKNRDELVGFQLMKKMKQEKRKIWSALGFEGEFNDEKFAQNVQALAEKSKQTGQAAVENEGRAKELSQENGQLKAKVSELQAKLTKANRELESKTVELEDLKINQEIATAANEVGFLDPEYAIELCRRHSRNLQDGQDLDPVKFFQDMKKDPKMKNFFHAENVAAGPRPAAEIQQPGQQGTTQGQNPPQPKPAAAAVSSNEPNVDKMSRQEFSKHAREAYGYSPGAA